MPTTTNPWLTWLETDPTMGWNAFRPQGSAQGGNSNFAEYWQGRQADVWSRYLGQLGNMALGGQAPNLAWTDYLKNFSFQGEWNALAPWKRGERYQPGIARWNNPF